MKYSLNDKLVNTNSLFDKEYFENMDLSEDMEKIYSLVSDTEEYNEYEKEMNLSKLRIDNHKKYYRIKINLIEDLPDKYYRDVKNIKNIYSKINASKLLTANYEESEKMKYKISELDKAFNELKFKVELDLKQLLKINNNDQKPWGFDTFKNLIYVKDELKKVLNYYDTLLIVTSNVYDDVFSEYKNEIVRRKIIVKIKKILNDEAEKLKNNEKLKELKLLNIKIENKIFELNGKLDYLDKLAPEDSEYLPDYNKFKKLYKALIEYDNTSLKEAKEIYKTLCLQDKLDIFIKRFETFFLKEVEKIIKGKDYEKLEENLEKLKDVVKNIDAYYNTLDKDDARYIRNLKRNIKDRIINISEEKENLNKIIRKIWKNYLTDIYSFNSKKDYHFICSNNQFILPKYECILLTKEIIKKEKKYGEYQIGFICNNVDNIMYITEKKDVMEVGEEELDYLKLPNQVENNFNNLKESYKIALDGNKTVLTAVYFIDDGDINKLNIAIELANTYNIPLIRMKRDN